MILTNTLRRNYFHLDESASSTDSKTLKGPTNQQTSFVFLQLFMNSTVGKSWEVELAEFRHSQCAVKQRKFPVKIIHPSTNYLFLSFFFPPVRPPVSLSFSLCLSPSLLRAVAGCFQRKRCRPSGLFINMLNGEQVFGRGNKAKIIINPVRWIHSITLGCIIIGVFFFSGVWREIVYKDNKTVGIFLRRPQELLVFFLFSPRLLSAVDGEGKKKKLCVIIQRLSFVCENQPLRSFTSFSSPVGLLIHLNSAADALSGTFFFPIFFFATVAIRHPVLQ